MRFSKSSSASNFESGIISCGSFCIVSVSMRHLPFSQEDIGRGKERLATTCGSRICMDMHHSITPNTIQESGSIIKAG